MVALKQTLLTICKNVGLICMYEVMLDSQTQRGPGIPQTWRVWIDHVGSVASELVSLLSYSEVW